MATRSDVDAAALEELLLRQRVERVLFREARLLDERDFSAWLELYAEDAVYWIPAIHDTIDPGHEVSIVYDRHDQLRERIWRLESGLAYAQEPSSRTAHVIGNVEVGVEDDGQLSAHSSFTMTEFRRERLRVYAGRCLHRLRPEGDDLRITFKKIVLVNNDGHLGNLSVLL